LAALEDFRTKFAADAVRERAVDHTVGPNEQNAIRVLAAAQAMPNISAKEKAQFIAAQHAVRLARFNKLPPKINAFQRTVNKQAVTTAVYLDKLLEIIRPYLLDMTEPDAPAPETPPVDPKQLPQIILSESFTAK
jgi:hypothetical protein